MTPRRQLIVSVPSGSGGSVTHLRAVFPRIVERCPEWQVTLFAPARMLEIAFGRIGRWMRPLPDALVFSPSGPPLNLSLPPDTTQLAAPL